MTNIFREFQNAIRERILSDAWIAAEPAPTVLTEEIGDLERSIDQSLNGNGIAIAVVTPRIKGGGDGDPDLRTVTVQVGIGERPSVNRGPTGTQKPGFDLAISIMALLARYTAVEGWTPLHYVDLVADKSDANLITWDLFFESRVRVEFFEE